MKGHRVIGSANDGIECIEKITAMDPKPDFIIMDHLMPRKNGIQTTKDLLSSFPQLRIVFLSGHRAVKDEALEAGARAFLEKPFPLDDFLSVFETILENEGKE